MCKNLKNSYLLFNSFLVKKFKLLQENVYNVLNLPRKKNSNF
jgi:hypothetical protein